MITAPSTAFGSCENTGASTISVAITSPPVVSEATRVRARRLVQRAGRQARGHGHPLEHAGPDVRHPLRDRLLVDIDPIPMPRGEGSARPRGLGIPDQQQCRRRDANRGEVIPHEREIWQRWRRAAAGHVPDERHSVGTEVEHGRCEQPRGHEHQRARDGRGQESRSARMERERQQPDEQSRPSGCRRAIRSMSPALAPSRCHPSTTFRSASAAPR